MMNKSQLSVLMLLRVTFMLLAPALPLNRLRYTYEPGTVLRTPLQGNPVQNPRDIRR
jgi:hypothetical protein